MVKQILDFIVLLRHALPCHEQSCNFGMRLQFIPIALSLKGSFNACKSAAAGSSCHLSSVRRCAAFWCDLFSSLCCNYKQHWNSTSLPWPWNSRSTSFLEMPADSALGGVILFKVSPTSPCSQGAPQLALKHCLDLAGHKTACHMHKANKRQAIYVQAPARRRREGG